MSDETETNGTNGSNDQMIPKSRLDEVIRQRDEARSKVSALEGQVEDMKSKVDSYSALASESQKYQAKIQELEASLESERTTWGRDKMLLRHGIQDEDAADLIKLKFEKQMESGEKDFDKWFGTEKDKDYVKPFLTQAGKKTDNGAGAETSNTDPEQAATQQTQTNPRMGNGDPANTGNPRTPSPGSEFDPVAIRNMTPEEFASQATDIIKNMWPTSQNQ